jgi:hypothetical protein
MRLDAEDPATITAITRRRSDRARRRHRPRRTALLRGLAVANVVRHGDADELRARVADEETDVVVEIWDDGRALTPAVPTTASFR